MNVSTNAAVSAVSLDKNISSDESTNESTNENAALTKVASLAQLSDSELLVATRLLVGRSNQLLASLLSHLAEVEARGVHRTRACSSLYAYCIYELRFSEDEAYRRVTAARLVRRFPPLREAIATGELHLTGLLMLGPYLTEQNLAEVLARAKHRTKKEIARLVRVLDPLPDVPPRIEPLGPARSSLVPKTPTWSALVQSMCPVRELQPGDRPRDWMTSEPQVTNAPEQLMPPPEQPMPALGQPVSAPDSVPAPEQPIPAPEQPIPAPEQPIPAPEQPIPAPEQPIPAPARLTPQRYAVQFTANEEYVKLVEEARALLSHSEPRLALDELHLRAMRAFVTELKRRKYAVPKGARKRTPDSADHESARDEPVPASMIAPADETTVLQGDEESRQAPALPRRRGRYVPANVRRAVFERDEGRCTFVDSSGQRCRETHGLELHHDLAFGRGGESTEQNLTLRCRAHNVLAAEQDFGKELIEQQRESDHERWTLVEAQSRVCVDVDSLGESVVLTESVPGARRDGAD